MKRVASCLLAIVVGSLCSGTLAFGSTKMVRTKFNDTMHITSDGYSSRAATLTYQGVTYFNIPMITFALNLIGIDTKWDGENLVLVTSDFQKEVQGAVDFISNQASYINKIQNSTSLVDVNKHLDNVKQEMDVVSGWNTANNLDLSVKTTLIREMESVIEQLDGFRIKLSLLQNDTPDVTSVMTVRDQIDADIAVYNSLDSQMVDLEKQEGWID